jgi:hypothetical protein
MKWEHYDFRARGDHAYEKTDHTLDSAKTWALHLPFDNLEQRDKMLADMAVTGVECLTGEILGDPNDSWACWGEPVDEEGVDERFHLVVYFRASDARQAHDMGRIMSQVAKSDSWAVSTAGDWAEQTDKPVPPTAYISGLTAW